MHIDGTFDRSRARRRSLCVFVLLERGRDGGWWSWVVFECPCVSVVSESFLMNKQHTRYTQSTPSHSLYACTKGGFRPGFDAAAFRAPLAHSGRAQRTCSAATMAALSAIDAGTPAPAIRLPLDPAPTQPRERLFSQELGARLDLQARSSTMRRWTVAEEAGMP